MVGKVAITALHDPDELNEFASESGGSFEGNRFGLLTGQGRSGRGRGTRLELHSARRFGDSGPRRGDGGARWSRRDQRIHHDCVGITERKAVDVVPEAQWHRTTS